MTFNSITNNAFEQYKYAVSFAKQQSGEKDDNTESAAALSAIENSDYNIDGTLKEDEKVNAAFGAKEEKEVKDNPFTEVDESKKSHGKDGFEKAPPDCQCETCKNRRYQDVSNDRGVSCQNPTKMDPTKARSAVMSHEMEHVRREQMSAKSDDRIVVSQSVRIKNDICNECGRMYVSGGQTLTISRSNLSEFRSVLAGADVTSESKFQMIV